MPTFVVILLALNTLVLIGLFVIAIAFWLALKGANDTRDEMKRENSIRRDVTEQLKRV